MSDNSIREQIIKADEELIKTITTIKTVERRLPSYSDLKDFAMTQLPVAAIVGRLPVVVNHVNSRVGQVDQCISELKVDINVFMQENVNADTQISSLLDDFWRVLYTNPTRNGLGIFLELKAEENIETWPPFVAFQITCYHKYKHSTGGI